MMSDLISRQALINEIESMPFNNDIDRNLTIGIAVNQPSVDAIPITTLYEIGCKGEEVRFHVNGRLFAIRELAQ